MSGVPSWHPEAPGASETPRAAGAGNHPSAVVNASRPQPHPAGRRVLGVALMVSAAVVMAAGVILVARGVR